MSIYDLALDDWASLDEKATVDIEDLVKAKLAPLPGSATRILGLLQNENVTTHELAEAIGYDVALASRVMRLANSPMYAMQREVSTVSSAVAAVGMRTVYRALLCWWLPPTAFPKKCVR